jgi:hypothetical protein
MDVSSLNSGTVDTKLWLNPVVGDLKAKTVGSASFQITDAASNDTVQLSGGIYRRAASVSPVFSVIAVTPPFGAGMVDVGSLNTSEGEIPISALAAGCSYELYFSGKVLDASPGTAGNINFYPCFKNTQPTDYPDIITELVVNFAANAFEQGFEARMIFRIISTTDTTIQLECSSTTVSNQAAAGPSEVRHFTNTNVLTPSTPSRIASINGRLPFKIWATSGLGTYTFTRTQLYLRRLS